MMLLVPEMMIEAQERYEILRQIYAAQPVGRHLLTVQTELSDSITLKKWSGPGFWFTGPPGSV